MSGHQCLALAFGIKFQSHLEIEYVHKNRKKDLGKTLARSPEQFFLQIP